MIGPDPTLEIRIQQPIVELGGEFRGRLTRHGNLDDRVEPGESSKVRAVNLELRYSTEGRGTRDRKVIADDRFPVDAYGAVTVDFAYPVPTWAPISYDGELIRVLYEIEARVDVKLGFDRRSVVPVLVIPHGGAGLYQRPHPLPNAPSGPR